jgi:hypothetical protein
MTRQTKSFYSLGGSRAGFRFSRFCPLTLVAALAVGGAAHGLAQAAPDAAKPARQVKDKKPATEPGPKIVGGYIVHQTVELGGRIVANKAGSNAMWSTMVNQTTGLRVIGHDLEMHSVNTSKTPFFDTLTSSSYGYGGDPYDVSRLNLSKGRIYDFAGSFRRDRNYFDYNLLANSLLGPSALVPEPDSLHLFNTVRRNTDTKLTLLPLSRISFRAGFNHGTHEGPSYTSAHDGGDVQLLQWFRNASDTYTGGVDAKLAKRTTLSYDQFYVFYKGDSTFQLAGANYPILNGNGQMESLGVDTLATATCGTGANKTPEIFNGFANPYCSGSTVMSQVAPTRTTFPTEQLRFSSHYWNRLNMNGRVTYSGGVSNVNSFNETFTGLLTRTFTRQEIDTGGLGSNGQFAHNKRVNVNADYGFEAELSKNISISDAVHFWDFRVPGSNAVTSTVWAGTSATTPPNLNILTPLTALTPVTTTTPNSYFLNQKNLGNTVLGIFTVTPKFKISGGWRFNQRNIVDPGDDLTWHQNWLLLGTVIQPSHIIRLNMNLDAMSAKNANSDTPSNTYTREAPDKSIHFKARAIITPAKWVSLSVVANDYSAKNDDPLVNHTEHNQDFSFGAQFIPTDTLSLDFNYAHDDVFSQTDLCYVFTPTATAPLPYGASNAGTCVPTADNPTATSNLYLGNGYYDAPSNFFSAEVNYAPSKRFRLNGGGRVNSLNGRGEELNPLMVPGALQSRMLTPFADLEVKVAPQWTWHGNWNHHGYNEGGPAGPTAARDFHADVVTLSVKYAF